MKNINMKIDGQVIENIQINNFQTIEEMHFYENKIYSEIDRLQPGNKFIKLSDIFGDEFHQEWHKKSIELLEKQDQQYQESLLQDTPPQLNYII